MGAAFAAPRVARAAAYGDIDNDGALDILLTTNGGPALSVPQRRRNRIKVCALSWSAPSPIATASARWCDVSSGQR